MLKIFSAAALLAIAGAALAQSTPSTTTSDTPSVAPSATPSITPSATPSVTPSETPSVTPSQAPVVTQTPIAPPSAVGGLGKCENLIGTEKDKCLQDERAALGNTGGRAAGAGGTHAPGSSGTGSGTMAPQNTAPSGSVR